MDKILNYIIIFLLLAGIFAGGYFTHAYISKNKKNLNNNYQYSPEKTEWDSTLINGKWISNNDQYETLLVLDGINYLLVMVNQADKTLRMYSKGIYEIDSQSISFTPDLDATHPTDNNENNLYTRLAKNKFHADISFYKNEMIWSVEQVFMSSHIIENIKYPAHPYFRYANSNFVKWYSLKESK